MAGAAREPGQLAVVRIFDQGDRPVGAGVLIGRRHVVTAGHNLTVALGADDPVGKPVTLDFPLVAPGLKVTATVETYVPPVSQQASDLGGLVLTADPPAGVVPAPVLREPPAPGTRFQLFGVPDGRAAGFWMEAVSQGGTAGRLLQLRAAPESPIGVLPGYSGGPLWAPGPRGVFGIMLTSEELLNWSTAYALPAAELFRLWPVLDEACRPPSPYRGLSAFDSADRDLFFGRTREARLLADRVRANPSTLVVAGPGFGKSSLVRAGVAPLLEAEGHRVVQLDAGAAERSAAERIAEACAPLVHPAGADLAERVRTTVRLVELVERNGLGQLLGQLTADAPLVVVVDQLEELIAQRDGGVRELFDLLLPHCATRIDGRYDLRLLACLRLDYLAAATAQLPVETAEAPFNLAPMTADGLTEAIARPAELSGHIRFAPETVERIVADARAATDGAPGELLPLIEFTASELWGRATTSPIGPDDYHRLGGVSSALVRVADEAVDRLGAQAAPLAARMLTRLVRVGPEPPQDTRATVLSDDLSAQEWAVAQRLAGSRLVTITERPDGRLAVRLAHDALLTRWDRLRGWIAEDRAFRLWQADLAPARRRWSEERDPGALLRGGALDEARRWQRQRGDDLSESERELIAASIEEGRRERLRRTNQRTVWVGFAVLLVLTTVVMGIVWPVTRDRVTESLVQTSARLGNDPISRLVVDAAALRVHARPETIRPVLEDLLVHADTEALLPVGGGVSRLALAGDGGRVLVVDEDRRMSVWDVGGGPPRLVRTEEGVAGLATSPDGRLVAVGDTAGRIVVRDAASWAVTGTYEGPQSSDAPGAFVNGLSFDAAGERLVTVAETSRRVRLIDLRGGAVRDQVVDHGQDLYDRVGFTPGGGVVAGEPITGPVTWDPKNGRLSRVLLGEDSDDALYYGPESWLVHCVGGQVSLLDPLTGKAVRRAPFSGPGCPVQLVAAAGSRLLFLDISGQFDLQATGASLPHRLMLFDGDRLVAAVPLRPSVDPQGRLLPGGPFALGAAGRFLAFVEGGAVRVVRVPGGGAPEASSVDHATFLPDGGILVAHENGTLRRLAADGRPTAVRAAPGEPVAVSVAPDGRRVAVLAGAQNQQLVRYTLPELEPLGTPVPVPNPAEATGARITTLDDGRIIVHTGDALLVYPRQPDSAEPRRLDLSGADARAYAAVAARPGTAEVALIAPTGSGFQLVDVDRGTAGPVRGPVPGGRTRALHFDAEGNVVVLGDGATVVVDPDDGRIVDADDNAAFAELPDSGADAAQLVEGWPAVLDDWGMRARTPRLWEPRDRSPLTGSRMLLSPDRDRFLVISGPRVDVFPTDPGRWREPLCRIAAAGHEQARSHLGSIAWVTDPC
ncbi:hypothetical protein AB0J86_30415 [Micromonospora sp. NPDC049559]|uniref:nSTAND1 domain-containing NTPase n=1 Tax=Micromonospora sp. NPDC049559 TaxID=3155923 RepID=UPI0034161F8E